MNYYQAKQRIIRRRISGLVVIAFCLLVSLIGLLKFLYFGLDDGGPILQGLNTLLKNLVFTIYDHTRFLSLVWEHAPAPNLKQPFSLGMALFLVFYFGIFIGASLMQSASALSLRLRKIEQSIEDELIRASMRGEAQQSRQQLRIRVEVPQQSIWREAHTMYIAPLVVGLVLFVITKLAGA